ncbi:Cysteine-rich receptor-like protein kinase 25 [Morus notabilis]|uniref:Cysteine-rich receptor-like protein kinase 25 n=1 Tax=Morus notabilis TaxID=981085 RepID=W9QQH3_9ROSA|nr:Cysteine-rich receptor-like protein kinase 25 [Morus notabilis]
MLWYDECLLRYYNTSFFGQVATRPHIYLLNTANVTDKDRFSRLLNNTMKEAAVEAARGGLGEKKFATRDGNINGFQTLYNLVQCTPDLLGEDCGTCLTEAIGRLPEYCDGKLGGRVLFPSCNVRYEIYPFYSQNTSSLPPVASPPASPPPPSSITRSDVVIRFPTEELAMLWYDECLLRYYNTSFFGQVATRPHIYLLNTANVTDKDRFSRLLNNTMKEAAVEAARGGLGEKKFATRDGNINGFQTLYNLVQCTPDLLGEDCGTCLTEAIGRLPEYCDGKLGGRVLFPSCNVRYEIYPFYSQNTSSLPPVASPPASPPPPSSITRSDGEITTIESLQFDLATIESATNKFSAENKLGEGGFGEVFKGILHDEKQIAVKRLSKSSVQGAEEFKNEVVLLAKLQHRNLTLKIKQGELDWSRRHKIIGGIARGTLYLHEDTQLRIIHRDLKASNILLDADMNSKISDFGMARIFEVHQTQGNTSRIVGTYGYMSPEYAMHGQFSIKSDVYSFGVLILEIISGKKNSSFYESDYVEDLLSYVSILFLCSVTHQLRQDACTNSTTGTNLTANTTYYSNLNLLLSYLTSYATVNGGFHQTTVAANTADAATELFLCRSDIAVTRLSTCQECAGNASREVLRRCPTQKQAVIWHDECWIRYEDRSAFYTTPGVVPATSLFSSQSVVDTEADRFNDLLSNAMNTTADKAVNSRQLQGKKFGTDEEEFTSLQTLYSLAQCTPDLSAADCNTCLRSAIGFYPSCCSDKEGGTVFLHSCVTRYEFYSFYNVAGTKAVSPPPVRYEMERGDNLQFTMDEIETATDNFSDDNKIGEGGFVEGTLPNGQKIAVKRLLGRSGLGAEQFKNKALLVAKLQHRNLVRLLGFCLERDEKILIYEYVPNKSLDYFLFDDDMNPKIFSDFGMAKVFVVNQTHGSTNCIIGTYGYMSPEYAKYGHFSVKFDVFSFGVLVLEILSGKKNNFFHAWELWKEGTPLELLDPTIRHSFPRNEVMRCIHMGLLCVQENPALRPTMATIVLMLNSYSVTLPVPQQPAFFHRNRMQSSTAAKDHESDQFTSKSISWSVNDGSMITEVRYSVGVTESVITLYCNTFCDRESKIKPAKQLSRKLMQKRKGHQKMVSQFSAHTYSAGPRPDSDQSTKFKRLQRTERSYTLNDSLLDDVAVA